MDKKVMAVPGTLGVTRYGDDCTPREVALDDIEQAVRRTAEKYGMSVLTAKEKKHYDATYRGLHRARKVIESFNLAFFGEAERSLETVISDMKEFTFQANGIRQSRISMLLEELTGYRKAMENFNGKECHHDKDGTGRPETEETAGERTTETEGESSVFPQEKTGTDQAADCERRGQTGLDVKDMLNITG